MPSKASFFFLLLFLYRKLYFMLFKPFADLEIPLCSYVCEMSVMSIKSDPSWRTQSRQSTDWPPSSHSSTSLLQRYYGFQRVIFWLDLKMSLFISLEWMMRITNNQLCACAVKLNGQGKSHSRLILKWQTGQHEGPEPKNQEKHFSKWGVLRLTVPLIKMLTPREWSTVSSAAHFPFGTQMWTFTSQHTSRHLSQQPW